MAEKIKSISKAFIIVEDNSELLEIKSKKYTIDVSKDKKNNFILISIIRKEKISLRYKRKLNYSDFLSLNADFFIAFKNNILLLFKYLKRLVKAHLFSINYNIIDEEILTFTLISLKDTKQIVIEIILYNENNKSLVINKNDNNIEQNNNDNIDIDNEDDKDNNELNLLPAAPIVTFTKDENEENNNIFIYNPSIKNTKTVYYLYVYKKEYKEKNYKEIILKFVEKEKEKNNIEYFLYLDLIDFLNLSNSYYGLFDYSIDDIYDDLLVNLSNHNYIIDKSCNKCRIWLFIFTSNKAKEIYYQMSLLARKEERKRTENEINIKINSYFQDIFNYIKNLGDDIDDKNIQDLIHNPSKNNEKYLAQINISISNDYILEDEVNKNKSKNNIKSNSSENCESKKEINSNIENNIKDNIKSKNNELKKIERIFKKEDMNNN